MIFQDPLSYLNPIMSVGRQIVEGVKRHDPESNPNQRVAELLNLVRLPARVVNAYPFELSGGMRQRVLIAIALGCRPRLLIADEPTTALDVTTQSEILALIKQLQEQLGMALLLISHDLGVVAEMCEHVYIMRHGEIVESGQTAAVFGNPSNAYTTALMQANLGLKDQRGRFIAHEDTAMPPTISAVRI
jgi:ABC-type dipeptide/oligopeptide/nickel transport system ATPase component